MDLKGKHICIHFITVEQNNFKDYSMTHTDLIFMDPCIIDYSVEIPTRCSSVVEFIIPKFIEGSACFEQHTA
jgi:hypothetical protein